MVAKEFPLKNGTNRIAQRRGSKWVRRCCVIGGCETDIKLSETGGGRSYYADGSGDSEAVLDRQHRKRDQPGRGDEPERSAARVNEAELVRERREERTSI